MKPIKVLQFGEGNFLRAFADFAFCRMNGQGLFNGGVRVFNVRKTGSVETLRERRCRYHIVTRGVGADGRAVSETSLNDVIVDAVNPYTEFEKFVSSAEIAEAEFVVSNTTEAGIYFSEADSFCDAPPKSFPAKLAMLLFRRYEFFGADPSKGWTMLPCELIEKNGDVLKSCVLKYAALWRLPGGFTEWLEKSCTFCNTLVDRIVSGHPARDDKFITDQSVLDDPLAVVCEPYFLWAIEAPSSVSAKLSFTECGINAVFARDISPYRTRKVALLNAPHTAMAAVGLAIGLETVRDAVEDARLARFLNALVYGELAESLDIPRSETGAYARQIFNRFLNPYLEHRLAAIASNAVSKCAVRIVPQALIYRKKTGKIPKAMIFSLAANTLMAFKNGGLPEGAPEGFSSLTSAESFSLKLAECFFGADFSRDTELKKALVCAVKDITGRGMERALEDLRDGQNS